MIIISLYIDKIPKITRFYLSKQIHCVTNKIKDLTFAYPRTRIAKGLFAFLSEFVFVCGFCTPNTGEFRDGDSHKLRTYKLFHEEEGDSLFIYPWGMSRRTFTSSEARTFEL